MKVILANTSGFCFGVKRAVDQVYKQAASAAGSIYTYGPIIHNEEVVKDLEKKGVKVLASEEALDEITQGTVVIRSHGVSECIARKINEASDKMINATCPYVLKIHKIVRRQEDNGRSIIIIGNSSHPEVEGIRGWCRNKATVIGTKEEAHQFTADKTEKFCIVVQTTFNYIKFKELVEIISKKGYDILVLNTICDATWKRQDEAREIAEKVDAMIVIGGRHSSNTQKLFEICKKECENTYYIQTLNDLDLHKLQSIGSVGITAGASTPNNIIEEVHKAMSELSFEQMLEDSLKTIRNGEVVEGTVIDIKEDEIILNIGYKSDGIVTKAEYTNESNVDLRELVKVNDKMDVKVLKVNDGEGQVLLTYKRLAAEKVNKRLEEAFNNKEVLTGKVNQVLSGGLTVLIDESRIFIPASLVSDSYEKHLEKYLGQEIKFLITEFNPRKRRIIGNRKTLLMEEKAEMQKELFSRIAVGDIVEGTVKNVTDFGAFIDLGGADGLLHISEMSWGRVENPRKVFKVGEALRVLIKDINGEKIALSRKFEDENPWLDADVKYAVGNIVDGRVARMTDFGAFIELEPGVDALLHVSQISREHVEKPSDVLSIGQEVTAAVVDFNQEEKKISLSLKALENPVQEDIYYEEDYTEGYANDDELQDYDAEEEYEEYSEAGDVLEDDSYEEGSDDFDTKA